jgi:hypothetical protein
MLLVTVNLLVVFNEICGFTTKNGCISLRILLEYKISFSHDALRILAAAAPGVGSTGSQLRFAI